MTLDETADYCRVNRDTLMSYVKDGRFVQPVRIGRKYMFSRDAVTTFFNVVDKTSHLVDMLSDMRDDKRTGIEGRKLAAEILQAVVDGADPKEILEELRSAGAL